MQTLITVLPRTVMVNRVFDSGIMAAKVDATYKIENKRNKSFKC